MIDFGIIAAGDGNRIKEEGSLLAKPLLKIEGVPMIGRLISLMELAGAHTISIIVNSDMPEVMDYLNNLVPSLQCELKLIQKKTPSSMHSFYELLKIMDPQDKYVVTTVDTIFRRDKFLNYIETFKNQPKNFDGLMGVTSYIDDEKPLYVENSDSNVITGYSDNPHEKIKYVSAGVYGLCKSSLPVLQECIYTGVNRMRNFQRKLIKKGLSLKLYDLGKVIDVDHLSDLEKANSFLV